MADAGEACGDDVVGEACEDGHVGQAVAVEEELHEVPVVGGEVGHEVVEEVAEVVVVVVVGQVDGEGVEGEGLCRVAAAGVADGGECHPFDPRFLGASQVVLSQVFAALQQAQGGFLDKVAGQVEVAAGGAQT